MANSQKFAALQNMFQFVNFDLTWTGVLFGFVPYT